MGIAHGSPWHVPSCDAISSPPNTTKRRGFRYVLVMILDILKFQKTFYNSLSFWLRRFLLKDQTVSAKGLQKRERFGVLRLRQLNTNDCLFDGDNWRLQYIIGIIYMCVSGELEWDERELYTGELTMCELCTGELSTCEQTFHNSPPVNLTLVVERWSWQKNPCRDLLGAGLMSGAAL